MRHALTFLWVSTAVFAVSDVNACATHGTNAGSSTLVWTDETADFRLGEITITDNLFRPNNPRPASAG